jgi:hypothetical protein
MLEASSGSASGRSGREFGASIDGVGTDMKVQVRQFLQALILVASLCPERSAFRRTGVAPSVE